MTPLLKRILIVFGGVVAFLIVVPWVVLQFIDLDRYKPRIEPAASDALGMNVRVGGRLRMGLFPSFHITAEDGRILDDQGVVVASTKRARLWLRLLPLLRNGIRLRRIELTQPTLFIERDREGHFNIERLKKAVALLGTLDGGSLSLSGGALRYADRKSGAGFEATGFDLAVSRMLIAARNSPRPLNGVSLDAKLSCKTIKTKSLSVSDVSASAHGKDGVFELEPVVMHIFGGQATGSLHADVSGPVPLYEARCSLPHFRIEEFLKMLSPAKAAAGAMDFTASLSTQGTTGSQLVQSAAGDISLHSGHLTLEGHDLDAELSRFASTQSFNLADVSALFLAGPLGVAVTKGYNFGSLFSPAGGTSNIEHVVSDWKVEHGVARAKDVAMSTANNRIALQGGLDFVNERFADVVVAVIDAKGCAQVRQAIHGSFAKPTVEKPQIFTSLAGPVLKLYRRARRLLPERPCEVFYSGAVVAPK